MAIPALVAAAGSKLLGGVIGGYGNDAAIKRGQQQFNAAAGAGRDVLGQGKQVATTAYQPYTQAGVTGVTGLTDAITNRTQATNPTLQTTDPSQTSRFLDPSAAYSMDQANKATQAAGIAGGAMGGGMLKALSNNSSKMAQTNYNNAFNQQLQANNQNFGQEQQLYTNNNDFQQQQIQNYGNLANTGLNANNANQQLQLGYNTNINDSWLKQGDNAQSAYNSRGNNFNNTVTSLGNNLASGISSIWGGK